MRKRVPSGKQRQTFIESCFANAERGGPHTGQDLSELCGISRPHSIASTSPLGAGLRGGGRRFQFTADQKERSMNRFISRRPVALMLAAVGVVLVLPALIVSSTAQGTGPATAPRWSVVVTTAPHAPQDVWFTATGNNDDGWHGGGCLCLGGLAQGLGPTDHATILIDVVEGGVF